MERWSKILRLVLPLGLALGAGGIWLFSEPPGFPLVMIMGAGVLLGWAAALVIESAAYLTVAEPGITAPADCGVHDLEREKETLLRGIKEIELDVALGKLDPDEADGLTAPLRRRAISTLKELDLARSSRALTVEEQIERELARRRGAGGSAEEAS